MPNFEAVCELFNQEGIPYNKELLEFTGQGETRICIAAGDDLINHPRLRELLAEEINQANLELEEHEKIKKFIILKRRLSEETGEVTPTLKLKRNVVLQNFLQEIEGIYN
ncbi:MAG: long-chain fatty acid--CoA ligase [Firmicutes bacterium]|nr:long-chain fatty acid--CoA ligase [Bacillota bacterium]